jgi:hypothetical protein
MFGGVPRNRPVASRRESQQEGENLMSVAERRLISCPRLAVLATIAAACLGFSGVAHAKTPPDPNTVGATTLSHIELNGKLGTKLTVTAGEDVKIKANWQDNNTGCPTCVDQVAVAFAGNPVAGCIENGKFKHPEEPSGSGEVDLGPAPSTTKKVNVVALFEEAFDCGEFWNASQSTGYQVIARVKAKKPRKPEKPEKPEKPGKPQKPEKPEQPEQPEE